VRNLALVAKEGINPAPPCTCSHLVRPGRQTGTRVAALAEHDRGCDERDPECVFPIGPPIASADGTGSIFADRQSASITELSDGGCRRFLDSPAPELSGSLMKLQLNARPRWFDNPRSTTRSFFLCILQRLAAHDCRLSRSLPLKREPSLAQGNLYFAWG
jgi:hypothetical protein